MPDYLRVPVQDGNVLFEVTHAAGAGPEQVSRTGRNPIADLSEDLDAALKKIRPAAEGVLHTFTTLGMDTVQIEFGLNVDAQVGAVIAKTGVSGHFTINLTWTRQVGAPTLAAPASATSP